MLVHIERPTPRARYVVSHVLERMLGIDVSYTSGAEEFRNAKGPRLSYGEARFEGALHVPWSGAIEHLPSGDPAVIEEGSSRRIFLVDDDQDLFAGIFFLLSLTDELRCTERDEHGRVPSSGMFTVRKGFADRPWIDENVIALGTLLEREWPGVIQRVRRYSNCVTVDMDNILRYAARPFGRAVGATLKDALRGEWSAVAERWRVRGGASIDPYAQVLDLVGSHRQTVDRAIFFFLMRGGTEFDHAADPRSEVTRGLIRRASSIGEIGIHPSYRSSEENNLAEEERNGLHRIGAGTISLSRQHFLRWELPATLQRLSSANYHEDHTLGFADRAGFRAGTCTPFPWYDLEREQETRLMLHPFAVMDSALIEHMGLGPEEVLRTMNGMSDHVRRVSGTFISVWHDRYLSGHREFAPWPRIYEQVLQHSKA